MAALCLLTISCSKQNRTPEHPASSRPRLLAPVMDGEDDRPILMHLTQKIDHSAISNATVTLINGSDTLIEYSDVNGQCMFSLPSLGTWDITVSHAGFVTVHDTVNISDALTQRTNYMTEE